MNASSSVSLSGSPLSNADLKLINSALYKANQALEKIEAAEAAGADMSDIRVLRDDVLTQLTAIKQTYFPGQS